jgi:hypothetical protein
MKRFLVGLLLLSVLTGCSADDLKNKIHLPGSATEESTEVTTDIVEETTKVEETTEAPVSAKHEYTEEQQKLLEDIYVSNTLCKYTFFSGGYYLMTNQDTSDDIYAVRPVIGDEKDISGYPDAELHVTKGYIVAEPIPDIVAKSYVRCGETVYSISEKTLLYFEEDSDIKINGVLLKRDRFTGKINFKAADIHNVTYSSDFDTTDLSVSKITYKNFEYKAPVNWEPSKLEYAEPAEISLELNGKIKQLFKTSELTRDFYYLYNSMADKDNPSEYQFYKDGRIVASGKLVTNARLLISPEDYDEIIVFDCIISTI